MSKEDLELEKEHAFDKDIEFQLPKATKILFNIILIVLILLILTAYFYFILGTPQNIDPSKFGLSEIFIFLTIILAVINIPWGKMGIRIKKIGMLELEQVIKEQSSDNSIEFADLQKQIDELKEIKIENTQNNINTVNKKNINELDNLILKFLEEHSNYAFSPLRIKNYGGELDGFEKLKNVHTSEIRESLRRLLSKNKVETRISKKGNTIYIIKKH
jgi:hypothetical protein